MKKVDGKFVTLDGEKFYKIENYDCMEDFFMTITSSSDIWNFCWSQGGITAGRIDCDHAIFPYYTSDKVSDMKYVTGSDTRIAVTKDGKTTVWEPFAPFNKNEKLLKNIYKNPNGTKVWFEEINPELEIAFRYGWTSSAKYGLVKLSHIENLGSSKVHVSVLDGCRNIVPSCVDANMQRENSNLLDAYKKSDLDESTGLCMFSLSSKLSDKAEPSEALLANTGWFSVEGKVILNTKAALMFENSQGDLSSIPVTKVLKGERASCYIGLDFDLEKECTWEQTFDTFLNASKIAVLRNGLEKRAEMRKALFEDIKATDDLMTAYVKEADGIQESGEEMTCVHHRANVIFNIMRGGFFADNGRINAPDFIKFVGQRNQSKVEPAKKALGDYACKYSVEKSVLEELIASSGDPQLKRLFLEYLPMIFSRRHGDPSRPWNKFNIILNDKNGDPILNYEGNWRDIFQNWEPLAMSYPAYIKNMCAKFLNAMTADGFNPYRINREGIDWECPDPKNPWAQYGYWGDHQVIYFEKLLELWNKIDRASLLSSLDEKLYSTANVPYRLRTYAEICKDPRHSLAFDKELSDSMKAESKTAGSDKKLMQGKDGQPYLTSLTSKILQIVINKACNLVPGGGIWMNTQRPEWNDANNALAGYGLSVVTLCYLNRMLSFLKEIYSSSDACCFELPEAQKVCLDAIVKLYSEQGMLKAASDDKTRKEFTDRAGLIFEAERTEFFDKNNFAGATASVSKDDLVSALETIQKLVKQTIEVNKRSDGLYHTYNTLIIGEEEMSVKVLQEMLEGQVAVLSAGLLSSSEALSVIDAMKNSKLFESRQYSYMLYPNKELTDFLDKNNIPAAEIKGLESLIERTGKVILEKDERGMYHFNDEFANSRVMEEKLEVLEADKKPSSDELKLLLALYEKTFNHQDFTGRSGTFYAYEGLGSIYWHQVSKLLLAVQEIALAAYDAKDANADKLRDAYYDVRKGLSFNKTPEIYGAFPSDPYSHTPYLQGAKQPGMTGQVKEEVLTRWGELGVDIKGGIAMFNPKILKNEEFSDNKLCFTWCATPVVYEKSSSSKIKVEFADGSSAEHDGVELTQDETKKLFARNGGIRQIVVSVK